MKIAIIGSRNLTVLHPEHYIPSNCTEIVSGGAVGIDSCAAAFAKEKNLKLTEFLPDYKRYGRGAPIVYCRLCRRRDCLLGRKIARHKMGYRLL